MYITREIEPLIIDLLKGDRARGLILAGVVGVGKTTLIQHIVEQLSDIYEVFTFTGDDTVFRSKVEENSKYIYNEVTSATTKRSIVFVDEVQKSEAIFDALKYSFDQGKISFIVSGSNPAFLDTVAKARLQRRAEYLLLHPLSLPEILVNNKLIPPELLNISDLLLETPANLINNLPPISTSPEIVNLIDNYLTWGGLPLVHLTHKPKQKLREIRLIVERGFEPMFRDGERYADVIRVELSNLHSKEFGYQGIFQKTGIRRRDEINETIDDLVNHGYLLAKKPFIIEQDRRSYLVVYSYVDPGIVSFLSSSTDLYDNIGPRIEGYVHSRLWANIRRNPTKKNLWYYKPYSISADKVKFGSGEIDFVIESGRHLLPIEVKASRSLNGIDTNTLKKFMKQTGIKIGIVLYGGAPFWDKEQKILFWPYWLI